MPVVAIADCDHGTLAPERELLEPHGIDVREGIAEDADVLIVQYTTVDAELLDRVPRCRAVVRYGVGIDTVDVVAATARGVWVVNVPDYGTAEVADHTIALILALLRRVVVLDRSVHAGGWDHRVAPEPRRLSTLTLGLVGRGRIGAEVGRRAAAFGMTVLAHDPAFDASLPLDDLLAAADVVSLHAPLTPETRHLIDPRRMRPGDTARGLVVTRVAARAQDGGGARGVADTERRAAPIARERPMTFTDRIARRLDHCSRAGA